MIFPLEVHVRSTSAAAALLVCCNLAFSPTAALADATAPVPSLGVSVVVNSGDGVSTLTREQVASIFSGAITNWKQVGGADLPITVFLRVANPIESTFEHVYMDGAHVSASAA